MGCGLIFGGLAGYVLYREFCRKHGLESGEHSPSDWRGHWGHWGWGHSHPNPLFNPAGNEAVSGKEWAQWGEEAGRGAWRRTKEVVTETAKSVQKQVEEIKTWDFVSTIRIQILMVSL